MDMTLHITNFILSVVYTVLGLAVFAAAFVILEKITPFSIWKEIEEDQNVALAIMFGAIVIGLAMIISAAIT